MRRVGALALGVVGCLVFAAPAGAQGWRWLEKLSGPGDFYGIEMSQKIYCEYEASPLRVATGSLPCLYKDRSDDKLGPTKRISAAGVSVSYLRALSNDLAYAPTEQHVDRTVKIVAFEAFYDHRLMGNQRLDAGVAVALNWFVVPRADNFTRMSVEPRLTGKLFDMKQGEKYIGTFSLRVGVHIFTRGFKDTDFGAIPGTYESGTEISPSFRFVFDFDVNPFGK